MIEVVVIVESEADARIATKLAERVLLEQVDWLEPEYLESTIAWQGLEESTQHSCWKDIRGIANRARQSGIRMPRYLGHGKDGPLEADGAVALKALNLVRAQRQRQTAAVILIRDLDNQPERRTGIEQARESHPQLEIIIGMADRNRETWVLNGFVPDDLTETKALKEIAAQLTFDPCLEAHRLRSNSFDEPDRDRNPKVVLKKLTNGDFAREQKCWTETCLNVLRTRGTTTGLTAYLAEIEELLVPIIR